MSSHTLEGKKKTQNGVKRLILTVLSILLEVVFLVGIFKGLNQFFFFIDDFIEISYEMKKLPITFSTPANSMTMIGSFFFLNKRYIQMIKIPPCIQLIC